GSVIRFRVQTTWERHRFWIVTSVSGLLAEAALISGLLLNLIWRRRAERSLREKDERMNLAASAVEMCLWDLDLTTDRVWVTRPLAQRISQKEQENTDYIQVFQGIHPDDQNRVAAALKKARMGEGDFDSVHRRVLPDGKIIWV